MRQSIGLLLVALGFGAGHAGAGQSGPAAPVSPARAYVARAYVPENYLMPLTAPLPAGAGAVPLLGREVTFRRDADSHFYVTAKVNGVPIRFLVDTGASVVMLRAADARRAGINVTSKDYDDEVIGIDGSSAIANVKLGSMDVGGIRLTNIDAAVDSGGLDVSLLGQNYLAQLDRMVIEHDRMTLQ